MHIYKREPDLLELGKQNEPFLGFFVIVFLTVCLIFITEVYFYDKRYQNKSKIMNSGAEERAYTLKFRE